MLDGLKTQRLLKELNDNFTDVNLELKLTMRLDPPITLNEIAHGVGSRAEKILLVIRHFEACGKLISLLQWAQEFRPDVPYFGELLGQLVPAGVAPADIDFFKDPLLVSGDQPFVNRHDLRQQLSHLRDANRRVCVVEGPRNSGRSHSLRLIAYGAQKYNFKLCYIDLLRLQLPGEDLRPEQVGTALALQMNLGPPPARNSEQDAAWNRTFGSWFQGKAQQLSPQKYWVVIDHSDRVPLRPGVEDFLIELVGVCDKLDNVCLILLGYQAADRLESELFLVWPVSREKIQAIDETHLMEFFHTFFNRRRAEFNLANDDAVVIKTAQSVKRVQASQKKLQDQPNAPDALDCLKQAVAAEIKNLILGEAVHES